MALTALQREEIIKCATDKAYFRGTYLKTVNKRAMLVSLQWNNARRIIHDDLQRYNWIYYVKSRQLGASTEIAADFFHDVMFTPNRKALVIAHLRPSAKEIFSKIYRPFYDNLPKWMREVFRLESSSTEKLQFAHGGKIVVTTAGSEESRSGPYDRLHASECSRYKDFKATIASIFGTATPGAKIVFETTADGPNEAWKFWQGSGDYEHAKQFHKRFLGYDLDHECRGKRTSKMVYEITLKVDEETGVRTTHETNFETDPLNRWEADYMKGNDLDLEQMAWVRWAKGVKCVGDENIFHQEYPIRADLAFILSGKPYFSVMYPDAEAGNDEPGELLFGPPEAAPFKVYALGADCASGMPDGDWSFGLLQDVTDPNRVHDVASVAYRLKTLQFAKVLYELGMRYKAFITIERNTYGAAVIERLIELGYPWMFRQLKMGSAKDKIMEVVGFATQEASRKLALDRLHLALQSRAYRPTCPRVQRHINSFVYNDRGKPEHSAGRFDDGVFAAAMNQAALEEIARHRESQITTRRPSTVWEVADYEMSTGRVFTGDETFGDDGSDVFPQPESVGDVISGSWR